MKTARMAAKLRPPDDELPRVAAVPRQQFVDPVGAMIGDSAQHVSQPGLRIDVIHFCCGNEAIYGGSTLSDAAT